MKKIQMTEDMARQIHEDCILNYKPTTPDFFIRSMENNGYIRKAELENMVDEAEELYKSYSSHNANLIESVTAMNKLYLAIQALKEFLPQFRGKK